MKKDRKHSEKRIAIKMFICLIYLIIITILFVCSYRLFEQKKDIIPWSEVENVEDYTYIDVYKMSEKFAYYEKTNVGIHFVIEKEETGLWHTYLIAINEDDYNKYKNIIDYTYERTDTVPDPVRVYGYPVIVSDDLKALAIKNIPNFVPAENEITISEDNYETYLTNSYLDTTQERQEKFSIILCVTFMLLFILIILLIVTIFDKDKLVDNLDDEIERTTHMLKTKYKKK
jgi:predicted nucleic acid-binding Zn ribbon protein